MPRTQTLRAPAAKPGQKRNVKAHRFPVSQARQSALKGHQACVVWLTGLSGSGKSTIASALHARLHARRVHTQVLDGDNLRLGLNADLGFSRADRRENIRRAGAVAKLSVEAGLVVVAAFISPYRVDRERVRRLFAPGEFVEVFVDCPLAVCRRRDPKGLYQKAQARALRAFTGIQAPYEPPADPELALRTDKLGVQAAVQKIIGHLEKTGVLSRSRGSLKPKR